MINQPIGTRGAAIMLLTDRQNVLIREMIILGHQVDAARKKRRGIDLPVSLWTRMRLRSEYRRLSAEYDTICRQLVALNPLSNPFAGFPVANEF